jgi:DNA-binding MarR family transcriptional regulator
MSGHLSKEEDAAYQALMRVVFALPRAVTADIVPVCGLGLSEYMVLETLSNAPNRQLRVKEFVSACGLSLSGVSRIIDRLDREGLIRRVRSQEDGRGTVAVLTDAGQASLEQVYLVHLTSIRRHIFQHLGAVDLARLTSSMECIADSLLADITARSDRRARHLSDSADRGPERVFPRVHRRHG